MAAVVDQPTRGRALDAGSGAQLAQPPADREVRPSGRRRGRPATRGRARCAPRSRARGCAEGRPCLRARRHGCAAAARRSPGPAPLVAGPSRTPHGARRSTRAPSEGDGPPATSAYWWLSIAPGSRSACRTPARLRGAAGGPVPGRRGAGGNARRPCAPRCRTPRQRRPPKRAVALDEPHIMPAPREGEGGRQPCDPTSSVAGRANRGRSATSADHTCRKRAWTGGGGGCTLRVARTRVATCIRGWKIGGRTL